MLFSAKCLCEKSVLFLRDLSRLSYSYHEHTCVCVCVCVCFVCLSALNGRYLLSV